MSLLSNIANGVWNNVKMSVVKSGTYQLSRAVTADTAELLMYGSTTGHHIALASKRVGYGIASYMSLSTASSMYRHYRELEDIKAARENRKEIKELIKNKIENSEQAYGHVNIEGLGDVVATDINGKKVPEALILYYKGEQDIVVKEDTINGGSVTKGTTKYVYFIDTAAEITMGTTKNVVMTNVQGRDFSRKELISGGDLKFSINGEAATDIPDMYPENEVQKLISIAEYGGIINVNNLIFGQFKVDRLLITDFRLEKQQCKNIQPYTMSCVAVEPDTDVVVTSDTIDLINYNIQRQNRNSFDDVALALRETGRLTGLDYSLADLIRTIGGGAI